MSERRRSIGRLIALQERRERIAAARLGVAEADKAAILARRDAVMTFLDGAALTGPMALLAMRRVRDLAAQEAAAETRRAALADRRQEAGIRLKLAERVALPILRQEQEAADRVTLERLIEAAVGRESSDEG